MDERGETAAGSGETRSLEVPDPSVVLLVGTAGCGKSTFARERFTATEILSSDQLRAVVSDDPDDQSASADAFAALRFLLEKRAKRGLLTVVDATNLERGHRRQLISIGRDHDVPTVAIVLDVEHELCRQRNEARADRTVPGHVLDDQRRALERSLDQLPEEDIADVHVLASAAEVDDAEVVRRRTRERTVHGGGADGG